MFKRPGILISITLMTYGVSYVYLAIYHHTFWLFPKIIHEGGTFTLLETMFYASHFLGHIPVHTVLACYFVGVWLSLFPSDNLQSTPGRTVRYIWLCIALVGLSFIFSLQYFGIEDTFAFILQKKQSVSVYQLGGAWILHFPSTVLLFFFIPPYLIVVRWWFGLPLNFTRNGSRLIYVAFGLMILLMMVVAAPWNSYLELWSNPRYMAHSVRELATFPLTYFPLVLFSFVAVEKKTLAASSSKSRLSRGLILLFLTIFFSGSVYQVVMVLSAGVGNMAQKPFFAHQGSLSIGYLLASHYFEHFLDSLYFFLLCEILLSYYCLLDSPTKRLRLSMKVPFCFLM